MLKFDVSILADTILEYLSSMISVSETKNHLGYGIRYVAIISM